MSARRRPCRPPRARGRPASWCHRPGPGRRCPGHASPVDRREVVSDRGERDEVPVAGRRTPREPSPPAPPVPFPRELASRRPPRGHGRRFHAPRASSTARLRRHGPEGDEERPSGETGREGGAALPPPGKTPDPARRSTTLSVNTQNKPANVPRPRAATFRRSRRMRRSGRRPRSGSEEAASPPGPFVPGPREGRVSFGWWRCRGRRRPSSARRQQRGCRRSTRTRRSGRRRRSPARTRRLRRWRRGFPRRVRPARRAGPGIAHEYVGGRPVGVPREVARGGVNATMRPSAEIAGAEEKPSTYPRRSIPEAARDQGRGLCGAVTPTKTSLTVGIGCREVAGERGEDHCPPSAEMDGSAESEAPAWTGRPGARHEREIVPRRQRRPRRASRDHRHEGAPAGPPPERATPVPSPPGIISPRLGSPCPDDTNARLSGSHAAADRRRCDVPGHASGPPGAW